MGPKKSDEAEEELVDCRVDHYQTPRSVIVSVFGKQADKEASSVKFEVEAVRSLSHTLSRGRSSPSPRQLMRVLLRRCTST